MEIKRPLLLISNDDGYQSKGIRELVEMVSDFGDIIVCAPDSARSGFSCAFSATTPLRLTLQQKREGVEVWSCNGTPTDCVKMALAELCPRKPDMVIGGINHGDNGSVNTHYSGTMGVVLEGCMKYIPSVAFSLCDHRDDADFEPLRPLIRQITQRVLAEGLPQGVCLNVNFPLVDVFKGVKVCRIGATRLPSVITLVVTITGGWWAITRTTSQRPRIPITGPSRMATSPSPPLRSTSLPTKPSISSKAGV